MRGESSEITSYDNDGYLMGQRLTLSPHRVVDELIVTAGYLGDFRDPSVTRRLHRLSENYGQVLVKKKLTDRLTASADFTEEEGERTRHGAFQGDGGGGRPLCLQDPDAPERGHDRAVHV